MVVGRSGADAYIRAITLLYKMVLVLVLRVAGGFFFSTPLFLSFSPSLSLSLSLSLALSSARDTTQHGINIINNDNNNHNNNNGGDK